MLNLHATELKALKYLTLEKNVLEMSGRYFSVVQFQIYIENQSVPSKKIILIIKINFLQLN